MRTADRGRQLSSTTSSQGSTDKLGLAIAAYQALGLSSTKPSGWNACGGLGGNSAECFYREPKSRI
jgi:hypothetical protein